MTDISSHLSPTTANFIVEYSDFEFIELIGRGSCGEVQKAKHKPTSQICAYKKLEIDKLENQELRDFVSEVEILSKCNSLFVLPFYGWTTKPPYSIVTQYFPNGSLHNYISSVSKKDSLTPTNKTIIMIGIAYGMKHIHSKGIIHRDLKPMNVLLDERLFPKISDFGISRIADRTTMINTSNAGTPMWMAPELFTESTYTNKVDVYSYAMILWEMLTECSPYPGKDISGIRKYVAESGLRPMIPHNAPTMLKGLITLCWDQNPKKRPSFRKIVDKLIQSNIYYEGSDMDLVSLTKQEFEKEEIIRNSIKFTQPPLKPYEKGYNSSSHQTPLEDQNDNPSVFVPTQIPSPEGFKSSIVSLSGSISDLDCIDYRKLFENELSRFINNSNASFFEKLVIGFKANSKNTHAIYVIREVFKIIQARQDIFVNFLSSGLMYCFPYGTDNKEIQYEILKIIRFISIMQPEFFTTPLLKNMNQMIVFHPILVLSIIQNLSKIFEKHPNGWCSVDYLLRTWEAFLKSSASNEFLILLSNFLKDYKAFFQARNEYCWSIFLYSLKNGTEKDIHVAYNAISSLFPISFSIDLDLIGVHIKSSEYIDDVLSYLLKTRSENINEQILIGIIDYIGQKRSAYPVMVCAANHQLNSRYLINIIDKWIRNDSIRIDQKLFLILSLNLNIENRKLISGNEYVHGFLQNVMKTKRIDYIDVVSTIIIKLIPYAHSKIIETFLPIYFKTAHEFRHRIVIHYLFQMSMLVLNYSSAPVIVAQFDWWVKFLHKDSEFRQHVIILISKLIERKELCKDVFTEYILNQIESLSSNTNLKNQIPKFPVLLRINPKRQINPHIFFYM